MSVLRSPTGSGTDVSFGGSQPNLSVVDSGAPPQITFRKRKLFDDNDPIRAELSEIRKQMSEMMAILTSVKNNQTDNTNKLYEEVTSIKNHINAINNTMEKIAVENNYLKTKLIGLETITENSQKKINLLEADVNKLKTSPPIASAAQGLQPHITYEEMVNELQERKLRSKNIIIHGIVESTIKLAAERQEYDKKETSKITKQIFADCPQSEKTFRLGKYKPGHTRAVKVCFNSSDIPKIILRNKNNHDLANIKIYADQTLIQRKYLQTLIDELHKRNSNGEINLRIKYIKGKITYQVINKYTDVEYDKKSLKFFYVNAGSIVRPGKFDELQCILASFQTSMHMIILTETWFKNEEMAKRFQIPEYTHYYNFRKDKRGGGVSIFVHNNLKHHPVEDYCIQHKHYLWIHVSKFCLDIGAIYNPDKSNMADFIETYSHQLATKRRAIVFGDYNLDLLDPNNLYTRKYKDTLKENGFKILNKINAKYCTRETTTTKTIIDHVCSNLKDNDFHFAIIESAMSDHKQIFFEVKRYQPTPLKKTNYTAIDYTKLYKYIEDNPVNTEKKVYERLHEKILLALSKSKIIKTKTLNPPQIDWINGDIIQAINNRNKLWKAFKTNASNLELMRDYEKARVETIRKVQKAKSEYYLKCFEERMTKPRKLWKLINDLSKNKIKDNNGPDKLVIDTNTVTDELEISEQLNTYFSTIGSALANQIPNKYKTNRYDTGNIAVISDATELNHLKPTTTDEIIKIIDKLDPNTGSGIDGISTKAIKCIKNLILEELTFCINESFEISTFPSSLKIAKVIPIYKSGNRFDPCNYRPISVLPVISKIFEKVIYIRLETFLKSKDFFYSRQYGFRPLSNTLSATIDLITKIKNKIDQKQIVLGIFIDLKKAFDTISHEILLQKLFNIGIKDKALRILTSYLSGREQIVKIGQHHSSPKYLTYGVPQGSILGPLLYLIYINDISQIGLKGDISLYADDTCLFYYGHSVDAMKPQIQNDLNMLNDWFQHNLLTINTKKTNYVIFAAKNKKIIEKYTTDHK
ncbi:unnamed protein product [Arctia plantaginis]|uniref:Reverse transcriptase domain-containing protein n=1 Tax=Arctia plantaginis TaxID=874455 RepID=A0A8S1ANT3_ARCPL|nr:unnamed protein product [Arctia plantaginis]